MATKTDDITDDTPPPYAESARATSISEHRAQLQQYISFLPGAIRQREYEHKSKQYEQDVRYISRLVPEIEAFLSHVATLPKQPPRAELVMVPEPAVPDGWTLSEIEEQRKAGDVVQVSRVRESKDFDVGDAKPSMTDGRSTETNNAGISASETVGVEFDEWGRWPGSADDPISSGNGSGSASRWWWCDEEMARRLAAHLSLPKVADHKANDLPVAVALEISRRGQQKTGSWLSWATGRRKPTDVAVASPPKQKAVETAGQVSVTACAREVTFRRQNELGIYESLTGWGIVLRVACA
ncbi:hypothetical protein CMQ_193 [Grosmannia clavigera kw1407]|uniref:Uncharacterized protein n=1 Tax=Grosmannia clavigera (strain kw1407 / UAMH 11150) TaxID=655863 RepID=F0XQM8_GROCL|nr:uncharacterized protein CMQ_193 [Grosmannia clavigera kw1407]EFW99875.1 hypothetical protein CMQ_193 [Grosmannia clavigera kw1407]